MRVAWMVALTVACGSPPGPQQPTVRAKNPADFSFQLVGDRALRDRDTVYALSDGSVIALAAASGDLRWNASLRGDHIAAAGANLAVLESSDWRHETMTLLAIDGHTVATCPFTIPEHRPANAADVQVFASGGTIYAMWLTDYERPPRGMREDDEEKRADDRARQGAHACGLVRFELGATCAAHADDPARLGLGGCRDVVDPPIASYAPVQGLLPDYVTDGSLEEQERQEVTEQDGTEVAWIVVTVIAQQSGHEIWRHQLSRQPAPYKPP
jgi:hypothetical protein